MTGIYKRGEISNVGRSKARGACKQICRAEMQTWISQIHKLLYFDNLNFQLVVQQRNPSTVSPTDRSIRTPETFRI